MKVNLIKNSIHIPEQNESFFYPSYVIIQAKFIKTDNFLCLLLL